MKKKIVLEYTINCSPKVLYTRLSTPGGLSEWFADDVNLIGETFSFFWNGSKQVADVLQKKENRYIRFRWTDEDEETYFEFRITVDELTGDVALVITDFAEDDEKDENIELWDSQITELRRAIGL